MNLRKIAGRVALKYAASGPSFDYKFNEEDSEKLVRNPNPHGVKKMVTQEYADRFLGKQPKKSPVENKPAPSTISKAKENKERVENQKKTNQKHSNGMNKPEYNKKGAEVTKDECVSFIKEFHPAFEEAASWGEGFKKSGAMSFSGRLKDENSLHDKMKGRFKERTLNSAGDIVGSRAICKNMNDVKKIISHVYDTYDVLEHDDSVEEKVRPEGYRAHHFTIKSSDGKLIELQVKTQNQQLWSGYTHDTIYKAEDPEIIQAKPDIDKYTKAVSDYIYAVDTGKDPGSFPETPEILKKKNLAFPANDIVR
jgi:ppGpp synthetase/RelA/SpoT-type nucleotidyltranferase